MGLEMCLFLGGWGRKEGRGKKVRRGKGRERILSQFHAWCKPDLGFDLTTLIS